ncbi:MAG: PaaI family thioesterase [Ruminococcaceae bacterium]|mgnify:FL=1|nr:PaaI family thioesterase [Oscillospiraceae bacterium]
MRKLNPEHVAAAIAYSAQVPFLKLAAVCLTGLEDGGISRMELTLDERHMNPEGGPHGGVYATLVDSATWWAVYAALQEDVGHTTLDLHVDDLGRALGGTLFVEGRCVKLGRTICQAEAFIRDESGKLVVHGTSKLMVVPGIPTISQAAEKTGPGPMPPKYLD